PGHGDEPLPFGDARADKIAGFREADDDLFAAEEKEPHPLLQQAMDLLERLRSSFPDEDPRSAPSLGTLYQGAGDLIGGLAQALTHREQDAEDYGPRVVQLKRALRGAAFALGALFPLRSILSARRFDELFRTLQQMETDIASELGRVRFQYWGDDG